MARSCTTCQHLKRPEIDRRLAAGEPSAQVARDYGLNTSSLHRHRVNCLKLAASNVIKKDAARGSAAAALLPSREVLSSAYLELRDRIDQIVVQAEQQGSLSVAVSGLNSVRHTLDSLARLATSDRDVGAKASAPQPTNGRSASEIAKLLIEEFDHDPDTKARIAQALVKIADQAATATPSTAPPLRTPNHQDQRGVPNYHQVQPLAPVLDKSGQDAQRFLAAAGQPIVVPQQSPEPPPTAQPPVAQSGSSANHEQHDQATAGHQSAKRH